MKCSLEYLRGESLGRSSKIRDGQAHLIAPLLQLCVDYGGLKSGDETGGRNLKEGVQGTHLCEIFSFRCTADVRDNRKERVLRDWPEQTPPPKRSEDDARRPFSSVSENDASIPTASNDPLSFRAMRTRGPDAESRCTKKGENCHAHEPEKEVRAALGAPLVILTVRLSLRRH